MLLPHGYEGQGPEHSSARLERFLQLCAENNIQVCNVTTPAQYFHVLRRQLQRAVPQAADHHDAQEPAAPSAGRLAGGGASRRAVLGDPRRPARSHELEEARRVVFCSGKLFYDLWQQRERQPEAQRRVALLRVEQFYPFCDWRMLQTVQRYGKAEEVVWAQEEPQNRGGWSFMQGRLQTFFPI